MKPSRRADAALPRALLCWLVLLCAAPAEGWAQAPPSALPLPKAAAPAEAADPAAERARLEELARTLEDDQARSRLIEQLRALSAAQPDAAAEGDWLTRSVVALRQAATRRVEATAGSLGELAVSVRAVPELASWLGQQLSDQVNRAIWRTVLTQIGLAASLGVLASLAVRLLLRGWRGRRSMLAPAAPLRAKLTAGAARLAVDIVSLVVFVAVTYGALQFLQVTYLARLVAIDLLTGAALARMLTATSRAVLAADQPPARVPPLTDRQAEAARRWFSIVSGLAIYGHVGLTAALRLGLPWGVHGFLRHLLFAVVTALIVAGIFRVRGQVAAAIRGFGEAGHSWMHPLVPWSALATAGPYVLTVWVVLQYLVWALRIPEGTVLLTRGALGTILALALLRALSVSLDRLLLPKPSPVPNEALPLAGEPSPTEAEPLPQVPAGRTLLATGVRLAGALLAAAVILRAWGFAVEEWLLSETARDIAGRVVSVLLVAGAAGLGWWAVDRVARRYIHAKDAEGNPVHNNRTRTLANIVRNLALTVALFLTVGHLLTELGVNTAALLAGAGVVGFAIGFGSQKLVQDLTTGLFILLGDTIRVGDVVQVGGLGGVVEAVSMRTVTLRAYNGDVHTIPYSSISIVTNMTKDYAFAVFNVSVGYGEDVDRVIEVLREIDGQLRREWPYRRLMPEPLDVAGVDAFTERGVTIVARSRTRAGEQWKVQREFNRRMKKRFDELGIAFPVPQSLVHLAETAPPREQAPPAGAAPPRRGSFPRPAEVARGGEA